MINISSSQRLMVGLLILAFILTLCITELSSYLRLKEAGSVCTPWPSCYAQLPELLQQETLPDPTILTPNQSLKRVHRIVATLLVIVIIFIVFNAYKIQRKSIVSRRVPLALFFILLLLSLIGPFTPQKLYPIIAVANIILGMLLLSLIAWLWWDLRNPQQALSHSAEKLRPLFRWGSRLMLVNIISGAWSSANFAATLSQQSLLSSTLIGDVLSAFNPFVKLDIAASGNIIANASMSIIYNMHFGLGLISVVFYAVIAYVSIKSDRQTFIIPVSTLLGLFILGASLGIFVDIRPAPLYLTLTHHFIAVLLLLSAFRLMHLVTPSTLEINK